MTETATIPAPRKRGGQPGNANRLRHGRFSKAWRARDLTRRSAIRKVEALILRAHMVLRMRGALKRKLMRAVPAIARRVKMAAASAARKFPTSAPAPLRLSSPAIEGPS